MRIGKWVSWIAFASTLSAITLTCRAKPQPVRYERGAVKSPSDRPEQKLSFAVEGSRVCAVPS
jgi:hypothetical protein